MNRIINYCFTVIFILLGIILVLLFMDKDAYMLKPEVNSAQCLEHTRSTLEKASLSRNLGGTIIGNGAWVHCDVLPKGKEKYGKNNSRNL